MIKKVQKVPFPKGSSRGNGAFVLFILDPFETSAGPYNFVKDTSHLLMLELQQRGFSVFYSEPSDLQAIKGHLEIKTRRVHVLAQAPYFSFEESQNLPATRFRLIWVRKDPPVDTAYLYMTQLLSLVADRVPIINAPRALRDWNEKLVTLNFPQWITSTLVTSDRREIENFLQEKGPVLLKPLSGFGGQGIQLLSTEYPDSGPLPVLVQTYLEKVRLGEKRVFFVNSRPLGALLKVPQKGFVTNPDQGAHISSTTLTAREKKIGEELSPFFKKEGVFFAGVDLIDGFLTDINITSPGLVWEWNEATNQHHERTIIDLVEKKYLKLS